MGDKKEASRETDLNGLLKTLEHEFLAGEDGVTNHWSVLSWDRNLEKSTNGEVRKMKEDYQTDYELYEAMIELLLDEQNDWKSRA